VTVTDRAGATASAKVTVVVGNPPDNQAPTVVAAADPAGGTAPLKVNFSAAGSDPDGDALSYVWSFGDGGAAGGPKVTHTFAAAGTYTVTVTVRDAGGKTGTATLTVVVAAAAQRVAADAPRTGAIVSIRGASVPAFARRGLSAVVSCGGADAARASLWVSRAAAKRLGLAGRRLGAASVACDTGKVRVKPSRAVRKRLAGRTRALRVQLRLTADGTALAKRSVTLRAGR
jgi:hypothetical protein